MTKATRSSAPAIQWREWNEESFALAKRLERPVLLDIGAAWCHWCHVMEETVYDDPDVSRLVNDLFVPIKVDTDLRPDINDRYNQGGWPSTVFLTPDGDILYGATFVPKQQFQQLSLKLAQFYQENREAIDERVKEIRGQLATHLQANPPPADAALSPEVIENVLQSIQDFYDSQFGGFGTPTGNKFPQPEVIDFLLYWHQRTGNSALLEMVEATLQGQALGGMYDHIGGGFHRYAVRPDWRIPHFEKMLKDHAGHIRNYLDAYQATGKEFYRQVALHTLEYVDSVLKDPEGGFYGSQDADVGPHDDGSYFTWSRRDVQAVLSPAECEVIVRYFGLDDERNAMPHGPSPSVLFGPDGKPLSAAGNSEVKHVLNVAFTIQDLAKVLGKSVNEIKSLMDSALAKMAAARAKRPAPSVDKHIFTDWNAMTVSTYFRAWAVLGEERYRAFALKTLDRLISSAFDPEMGMAHHIETGVGVKVNSVSGLLTDQVYMARALLDAFMISGERRYRDLAETLMEIAARRLWDDQCGGFWDIPLEKKGIGHLAIRQKSLEHNSVAADNLMRLWISTGKAEYRQRQRQTLLAFGNAHEKLGFLASVYAQAVAAFLDAPVLMHVVGRSDDERTHLLLRACAAFYEPRKVVVPLDPRFDAGRIKVLGFPVDSGPVVYTCVDQVCGAPVTDPKRLSDSVRSVIQKTRPA